jgi:DNA invertase Pin-like site-specific DNA recombinase
MLIGYAWVSTDDLRLGLQRDAWAAGCEKVFEEKHSAARAALLVRDELLAFARHGDVVVIWKLDRLGRSLRDLTGSAARSETLSSSWPSSPAEASSSARSTKR